MASQKGGVGKTTLCINLAHALATRGWNVLLADTDAQNGIGLSLARSTRKRRGFYDWISGREKDSSKLIIPTKLSGLSLLVAGQYDESAAAGWLSREVPQRIAELLLQTEDQGFDCVLFDSAAGVTGMTESIVKACDWVLIPQQAEPLAVRSIPHLLQTLGRFRQEGSKVQLAGIIMSMVMEESPISRRVVSELRAALPSSLLWPLSIPRSLRLLEASAHGVPVAMLGKTPSPEAQTFMELASQLEERCGLRDNSAPHCPCKSRGLTTPISTNCWPPFNSLAAAHPRPLNRRPSRRLSNPRPQVRPRQKPALPPVP